MNDTKRKTSIFTLFFAVVLLLCLAGALGALSPTEGTAYAETGQTKTAAFTPTQFTTTFNNIDKTYTITGFDTNDAAWTGATADQKKDIAIVIPATYNGDSGQQPVSAIADDAFNTTNSGYNNCTFTSLDLSGAIYLKSIGKYAFISCLNMAGTLTFPANGALTTIDRGAFQDCIRLSGALTIPNSVTTIGAYAFKDCSGFDGTLTLPTNDAFTTIGEYAFSSSGFTGALTIPNSVTTIEDSAFKGCSKLTGELTIPNSVTTIGNRAFYNCSGLTGALTIPNSVTTIGDSAFYNCSGFDGTLTLPNNGALTTIDVYAFYGCSKLTGALTIPDSVTTIGASAFSGCKGFNALTFSINSNVTMIGDSAFYRCGGFKGNLEIPNSVITIKFSAFRECSSLNGTLTLPTNSGFTTIEGNAFYGCSGLTGTLTIPNSVTTIGAGAFRNCSGLTGALTIPNSVTTIGSSAFFGCAKLSGALTIPDSVSYIGPYAFLNCSGFDGKLTLPTNNDFVQIERETFSACSGFSGNLAIPNSVKTIGDFAFSGCSGLTGEMKIPDSVTAIRSHAFAGCSGFSGALTIPNSVTTIGSAAFLDCSSLHGMLTLPTNSGFTTIGASAFSGCSGLIGSLTIPDSVTTIEANAFYDCSGLTGTLTIPDSVTSIGEYAFNGCSGLKTVYLPIFPGTVYQAGAFDGITCPIVTTQSLHDQYKADINHELNRGNLTYEVNVNFDANGGTISDGVQTKLFHYSIKMVKSADGVWAENANYKLPTASKTNYAFASWNSQADGEGAYSAETLLTSSINTGTPLTYYAQYSEVLSGITVTGTPNKSQYTAFEAFDTTGLTVTANYASGASATITDYTVKYTGGNTSLRYGDTAVTISYTENGLEKTATVSGISVNKIKLTAPTVSGTYTYSGSEQTVTLSGYDGNTMTVSNNKRTNVGEQNVTVALKDTTNYEWSNGTTAPLSLKWTIATAKIAKPDENTTTFTYNGSAQTYQLTENAAYSITGNVKTDAGEYVVTVVLNNPQGVINYEWTTGGSDALTFNFVIGKKAVAKPAISGTYEYNGSEQTANVVTTAEYTVTGNKQTDANTYTVTVTLDPNYKWSDDTEAALALEWKIARKKLTITPSYDTTAKVFVGGGLPAITTAETTAGVIAWNTPIDLSEPATDKAFGWTWTPTDTKNYEIVTGTVNFDVLAVRLESITASFNQGRNKVYPATTIETLRQWLTVTGTNNDGSAYSGTIDYELAGTLTVGSTNTITVTVKGTQISTTFNNVTVMATALEGIAVTTNPTRTEYTAFEDFEAAGMVVTATFSHGAEVIALKTGDSDGYTIVSGTSLTADMTALTISYAYGGETKTTTVAITVAKIRLDKPTIAGTYIYIKDTEQTAALDGFDYDKMTVANDKRTNAGTQNVSVALNDKINYEWKDGTNADLALKWTIEKESYDMSGVTFADVTVKADGAVHMIAATGIPDGVGVTYTGTNGYTSDGVDKAGVYEVTATFSVADAENYNVPESMTATLYINLSEVTGGGTDDNGDPEIIIGGGDGIQADTIVVVEDKPVEEYMNANIALSDKEQTVIQAANVKLMRGGTEIQPDSTVTVKMLIKSDLRRYDNLKVLYFAPDGTAQNIQAVREGNYMVFDTTRFSVVYAIVAPQNLLSVSVGAIFGIVFAVIIVLLILALLMPFLFRKDKEVGFKEYCVALGGTCASAVKGWGRKVKGLFVKDKAQDDTTDEGEKPENRKPN